MRSLLLVNVSGDVVRTAAPHQFHVEERVRLAGTFHAATAVDTERLQICDLVVPPELGGVIEIGRTKATSAGELFLSEVEEVQRAAEVAAVPEPTTCVISSVAFLDRFTQPERLAVHAAAATNPVLDDFRILCCAAGTIDLLSERVQQAMGFLVAGGLLTQARADEIVSTS